MFLNNGIQWNEIYLLKMFALNGFMLYISVDWEMRLSSKTLSTSFTNFLLRWKVYQSFLIIFRKYLIY